MYVRPYWCNPSFSSPAHSSHPPVLADASVVLLEIKLIVRSHLGRPLGPYQPDEKCLTVTLSDPVMGRLEQKVYVIWPCTPTYIWFAFAPSLFTNIYLQLLNQKPVQWLLLTFHCCATMLCCVLLIVTCWLYLSLIDMFAFYHVYRTSGPLYVIELYIPLYQLCYHFATPNVCY